MLVKHGAKASTFWIWLAFLALVLLLFAAMQYEWRKVLGQKNLAPWMQRRDTLVMYVFANNDPESISNLKFFVREAMQVGVEGLG